MSTDEYSTEMELYGVSPGIIRLIMIIVTVFSPFGFIPGFERGVFGVFYMLPGMYGLFWILVNPFVYLPLCLLNILYAHRLVRYYQAKSSRDSVYLMGLLSVLLPTAIILYISGMFGSFIIIYPLPLQFIIGLIILHRIEGPEVISPWSGMRLDLSWWKWRQSKRKDDWDPFEEEKKATKHEDWLEE
ncbi:MAG: hypothetical protein PVJ05_01440 [Candidatus Thorarchaeota archaeon]|jgi:hypothetical protein